MDKDMHYCAIKVLAQAAGFSPDDSEIIAYASQYVDDAVEHMPMRIQFQEKVPDFIARYPRYKDNWFDPVCTAHRGIGLVSVVLNPNIQRKVYVVFHLIPSQKYSGQEKFSYLTEEGCSFARDIVERSTDEFKGRGDRLRKLIKLGIALHTYADTFSHHGFSGRNKCRDNDRKKVTVYNNGRWDAFQKFNKIESILTPRFAHGAALAVPDISHLEWSCYRGSNKIVRKNPESYLTAAEEIFRILLSITKKKASWKGYSARLKHCISQTIALDFYTSENNAEFKIKFDIYRKAFPKIQFAYSEYEWRMRALHTAKYDWIHYTKKDYERSEYIHTHHHDLKWFYFHTEAYEQREYVMKYIKHDLK
jgi:hypothetical protein